MPWPEAVRLTAILRGDPTSMLAAVMEGWSHPISREALAMMDLYDLMHQVNSKTTPKPHPGRPFRPQGEARRFGKAAGRSRAEVVDILRRAGHTIPA